MQPESVKSAYPENVGGPGKGIELDVIAPSIPGIAGIIQQIVRFVGLAFVVSEQLNRQIDHGMLAAIRIKVYDYKNDVVAGGRRFAVK